MDKKLNDNEKNQRSNSRFKSVEKNQNEQTESNNYAKQKSHKKKKISKNSFSLFGCICVVAFILGVIFVPKSPTIDHSKAARDALKNQTSSSLSVGVVLLDNDDNNDTINAKDYTIAHDKKDKKTKIWVWDYASEDGDYVQVLVDDKPITDAFFIKNKPREIEVPSVGNVQIKGIKDGGGGITYAVKYEVNNKVYFNSTSLGNYNTYTLKNN